VTMSGVKKCESCKSRITREMFGESQSEFDRRRFCCRTCFSNRGTGTKMRMTTLYLGEEERASLEKLSRATNKNKSECIRLAIRDAANRLRKDI
jgi:hypothetical protein